MKATALLAPCGPFNPTVMNALSVGNKALQHRVAEKKPPSPGEAAQILSARC